MGILKKFMVLAVVFLFSLSYAEDYVAINSFDGRDVLSGTFYANVKGYPVKFMPSPAGNSEVFAAKIGSDHSILLIQSSTKPISGLVESELKAKGNEIEIYSSDDGGDTNLDLAKRSGATSFIIVDSAYSDSAISVLPYAALTHSYVILADKNNIDSVKQIVTGKSVMIYGFVDQKVRNELSGESPKVIGNGEDKYADNVEIARKTMEEFSLERPIMVDGSFIEDAMTSGSDPILLTGRVVPQATYDFVKEKVGQDKLSGVLLIGDSLVPAVYDMRERVKKDFEAQGENKTFGVMVKFAQAVPSAQGGVIALDTFYLPAYKPSLEITEVFYNKETGKVMVGLENIGEGALYYNIEVKVLLDGEDYRVFGESETSMVERGESDGLEYALDLTSVAEGDITATVLVKYGSAKNSLEEYANFEGELATIEYVDNSDIEVKYARYDSEKTVLSVTIKNNGEETAYAFSKLTLIDEQGMPTKISGASIREIEPLSLFVEEFPLVLSDMEIELNKEVTVSIDYGGRRGFLNKNEIYVVPLEQPEPEQQEPAQAESQLGTAAFGAVVALLIVAALYLIYRLATGKKRKK